MARTIEKWMMGTCTLLMVACSTEVFCKAANETESKRLVLGPVENNQAQNCEGNILGVKVDVSNLFDTITKIVINLKNSKSKEDICILSNELKNLEQKLTQSILPLLIQEAQGRNCEFFRNFTCPPLSSVQEAMELRYVYVPIFYKLGMTHEASQLAQTTFEYLFPQIHNEVNACVVRLFGETYKVDCENVVNQIFD